MGLKSIGYIDTLIGYLGGAWSPMLLSPLQFLYKLINTATVDDKSDNDNDANLIESPCAVFDGSDSIQVPVKASGVTVVSNSGTGTVDNYDPTIGILIFTAGTVWDVLFSDGTFYPLQEAGGTVAHDTVNGDHGTLPGITESVFWAGLQDTSHYSMQDGYSLYEKGGALDIYVPYDDDGNPLVITPQSGYTKTADRAGCLSDGAIHNGATTAIQQEASAEPTLGDSELYYAQADVLGSELVTNGGFDADTDWTKGSGWSISGGVAVYNTSGYSDINQTCLTVGKTVRFSVDVVATSGAVVKVAFGATGTQYQLSDGANELDAVVDGSDGRLFIFPLSAGVGTIDNVSVKEVIYAEGDPLKVTWADYLAWVSYSDDLTWLKFTSDGTSCRLSDSVIIDIDGDEAKYDLMTAWKGGGSCGGGTSPF